MSIANKESEEKQLIANSKKLDSHHTFQTSKDQLDNLLTLLENGYICGNSIYEESGFCVRQALQCK
eukprot:7666-Ditylum_brightwellii.AAC.1